MCVWSGIPFEILPFGWFASVRVITFWNWITKRLFSHGLSECRLPFEACCATVEFTQGSEQRWENVITKGNVIFLHLTLWRSWMSKRLKRPGGLRKACWWNANALLPNDQGTRFQFVPKFVKSQRTWLFLIRYFKRKLHLDASKRYMFAVFGGLARLHVSRVHASNERNCATGNWHNTQPFPGAKISVVKLSIMPGRRLLSINKPQERGEMVYL